MGYDKALAHLHGFSFEYLRGIKVRYVCDILRRCARREQMDVRYQLFLNHKIDAQTFLRETASIESKEVSKEEVQENAENTIAKFARKR